MTCMAGKGTRFLDRVPLVSFGVCQKASSTWEVAGWKWKAVLSVYTAGMLMSCFVAAAAVAELPVVFAVQRHDGGEVLSDAGESEVDSPPQEEAVLPSERVQE